MSRLRYINSPPIAAAHSSGRTPRAPGARGVAALVLLAASFASLTVLARYLNTGFTIPQQVYLRAGIGFAISAMAFGRRIRWRTVVLRTSRREWGVIALRAILLYLVGATLYSKAATIASIGDVSFIAALPLVSALGLALRRVPVTPARVMLVLGSVAGTAVLSAFGGGQGTGLVSWNRGDLLALVAMLAMAIAYLGRTWHDSTLNNYEITVLTVGVGALCVALVSVAMGQGLPHVAHRDPAALWSAVALAGLLNVLNIFLMNYAFEHVDPVRAGNLLTLECVWGLGFGLLFFDQWPTVGELVGGVVIVACAVGLNSVPRAEVASTKR